MAGNRVGSITIDARMDKRDFMTNSKDVARAISSLKSTVAQSSRDMKSSAAGYGTAMRQVVAASREANAQIREIDRSARGLKSQLDRLGQSKIATPALKETIKEIGNAEKALDSLRARQTKMNEMGTGYSSEFQKVRSEAERLAATMNAQYAQMKKNADIARVMREEIKTGRDSMTGQRLGTDDIIARKDAINQLSQAQKQLAKGYKENERTLNANIDEQQAMKDAGTWQSQQAKALDYDIKKQQEYIDKLKQTRDMMMQQEGVGYISGENTQEYKEAATRYAEIMQMRQKAMAQMDDDFKPPYLKYFESLPRMTSMISEGFGRIQNVASGAAYALVHPFQTLDRALGTVISTVGRAVSAFAKMAGNAAVSFLKRLASEARNAAVQLAKLAANAVSSGLKKIATWARAAAQGVLNFHKNNKRAHSGMGTSLKMILKYAFGIRSLFFLFRRLRRAVTDGFGELKKQNPEVKASLDSLSQALNALKGSLASAFAPILTAVAPALTTLMNMLTTVINTIGAFFAALTGKNTVAKSIGKIGSSAGKASGKVKELKRELAGFDELNILNGDNNNGGGGGGSGSGFAYENVPIESGIKDFADRMKELWAAGDFEGIGKEIAKYINKGIDKIDQLVSWDNVKDNVTKGVRAVVGIFNGLIDPVDGIDFDKLGKTVSNGVGTILNAFALLLDPNTGLDFAGAGVALARALNGFLGNPLMWNMAAKVLSMSARAFIKFSKALLWEFDEGKVATNIRNAIAQPGLWDGIAKSAWSAIKLAFNKAGNFVNVLLGGKDYSNAWGEAERMMRARPANIIPDVSYNGMWDELATNLGTGIKKAIKRFTEIVANLPTDEALKGILDWLEKVKDAALGREGEIGTMFGTVFQKIFSGVGTVVENFKKNASINGGQLADAINAMIEAALPEDGSGPAQIFTTAVTGAFDFIKAFLKGFSEKDAAERLKKAVRDIPWGDIAKEAWNAFKTAVEKLGNFLTVLFGGEVEDPNFTRMLRQRPASAGGGKNAGESTITNAVAKAIGTAFTGIKGIIESVDWSGLGAKIKEEIESVNWTEVGTQILDAFKALFSGLYTLIDNLAGGDNEGDGTTGKGAAAVVAGLGGLSFLKNLPAVLGIGGKGVAGAAGAAGGSALGWFGGGVGLVGGASVLAGFKLADYLDEKYAEVWDAIYAKLNEDTANFIAGHKDELAELDFGVNNDPLNDILALLSVKANELVEANDKNTTAIDANTEVQPAQPETTQEDTDVVRDVLEYVLGDVNKQPETTPEAQPQQWDIEWLQDDVASVQKAEEKLTDELDGLPDAVKLAIDVIKDGTMPGNVAELLNLTDESNKILQDYLDKHPEIVTGAHGDNGEPQRKGIRSTKSPAANVQEKAQAAMAEHQNQVTTESTESTNKLSKVSGKLAKLLKGGITTEGTTEVTLKGDSVEALNGKSKVNVGVNFVPGDGDEGDDEAKNGGLLGWLQALLDADTLEAQIALVKEGWENLKAWLGIDDNTPFSVFIELLKEKWDNIREFLGIPENGIIDTIVKAVLNGWPGILKALGLPEDATVGAVVKALMEKGWKGIAALFGLGDGNILEVVGKLLGTPATGSSSIGGLFGTLLQVAGFLLGNAASGSSSIGSLFGTLLQVAGKLLGTPATGSSKIGDVFGTILQVAGKLLGTAATGSSKIGDVFGTIANFYGKIIGKSDKSKDLNDQEVFGKSADFRGKITGKSDKSKDLNDPEVFGKSAGFLGKITGKSDKSKDLTEVFGKSAEFLGKLTGASSNSKSLGSIFGTVATFIANLTKTGSNWVSNGLSKWIAGNSDGSVSITANLIAGKVTGFAQAITKFFFGASGGVVKESGIVQFANGGRIMNSGRASWFDSVNKYAAGTSKAHGTVFVAGESGPEIMGHVNGRTEILNKSQLAEAIYGAVVSGMTKAVNALGSYLANHMSTCTNAIVSTIGSTAQLNAVRGLNYYEPAMANGGVMPYDVSAQIARSTTAIQGTLDENNEDLIQAMISAIGNASMQIVTAIQSQMRAGNSNNITPQQIINEINRQGMMYGRTPIKGV